MLQKTFNAKKTQNKTKNKNYTLHILKKYTSAPTL